MLHASSDELVRGDVGGVHQVLGRGQALAGQSIVDGPDPHGLVHARIGGLGVHHQPRRTFVAGLGEMGDVADPLAAGTGAEPGLRVIGQRDPINGPVIVVARAQGEKADNGKASLSRAVVIRRGPLKVPRPHAPQHGDRGQRRHPFGRVKMVERVQEQEAVGPDLHGVRLALGLGLGQAGVLDPMIVALVPVRGCHGAQSLRRNRGDGVQGRAQRLAQQLQPVQRADGGEHVRAVRALAPTRLQQTTLARGVE